MGGNRARAANRMAWGRKRAQERVCVEGGQAGAGRECLLMFSRVVVFPGTYVTREAAVDGRDVLETALLGAWARRGERGERAWAGS